MILQNTLANDENPLIYIKKIAKGEIQSNDGDCSRQEPRIERANGSDRVVSQGERNDDVRLYDNGRSTEIADGSGKGEIRGHENVRNGEEFHETEEVKSTVSENGYTVTDMQIIQFRRLLNKT